MNTKIQLLLRQASSEAIRAIKAVEPERADEHQERATCLSIEAARLLAAQDRPTLKHRAFVPNRP